jgi:hypothetical protein
MGRGRRRKKEGSVVSGRGRKRNVISTFYLAGVALQEGVANTFNHEAPHRQHPAH